MSLKDVVLVEKYRPKSIKEVVGKSKEQLLPYLNENNSLPHFIFHSTCPGTGKTSLAKAFANDLNCDLLLLNSSDERKIEVIRDKVKIFVSSLSSKKGVKKCVFLDEADGMLKTSQDALRNLMETYSSNCFFILSCNYINKIIDPIRSRCVVIDFSKCWDLEEAKSYISNIVKLEQLESKGVTSEVIDKIINIYKPNLRNMVMFLQKVKVNPYQALQDVSNKDVYDEFWAFFKDKKYNSAKNLLNEQNIDVELLNKWLFDKVISNYKELGSKKVKRCIELIASNERDFISGADKVLIFNCSLFEMMLAE